MHVLRSVYATASLVAVMALSACSGGGGGEPGTTLPGPTENLRADAGPDQSVFVGILVTLNGSKSTNANQTGLTYKWTLVKPTGSNAALSSDTSVTPTLTVDVEGTYEATLVVTDARQTNSSSAPDSVLVTAATSNLPPTADPGKNQEVFVNRPVSLDGSGSRASGNKHLTFNWSFSQQPSGSTSTFNDATSKTPSFTPDKPGSYKLRLVVNDGTKDSTEAFVTITAAVKPLPTADAGPPQSTKPGTPITLDGSKSFSATGDPLKTFSWSLQTIPAGGKASLTNADTKLATFTADNASTELYVVQLIVNDGTDDSKPVTVNITVTADAPTATASIIPPTVGVCRRVTLDGKASKDHTGVKDSSLLSYGWTLTPPGTSQAKLDNPGSSTPTFTTDFAGNYDVTLTVSEVVNGVTQQNSTPKLTVGANPTFSLASPPAAWTRQSNTGATCKGCHESSFSGTDNPVGDEDLSREGFRIGVKFSNPIPPDVATTGKNDGNHGDFKLTQNDIDDLCDFFQTH